MMKAEQAKRISDTVNREFLALTMPEGDEGAMEMLDKFRGAPEKFVDVVFNSPAFLAFSSRELLEWFVTEWTTFVLDQTRQKMLRQILTNVARGMRTN